jgi:hypothetical protein
VWGKKAPAKALFIPMPRDLWIMGRSHPTARPAVSTGSVNLDEIKALAALL